MDGRPRFDIEPITHTPEKPALKRITSPAEVSDACLDTVKNNNTLGIVTQFFGQTLNTGQQDQLKASEFWHRGKVSSGFPF
jgi:phytanoyl-CoA hydroxylase